MAKNAYEQRAEENMQRIYANRRAAQEAGINPNAGTRNALLNALLESSSNTARTLPQETQNNYRNQQAQQELRSAERDYNLVADALAGTSIGHEAQSRIADARRDVAQTNLRSRFREENGGTWHSVTEAQREQWYQEDRQNAETMLPELRRGLLDWEADYGLAQEALAGTETGRELEQERNRLDLERDRLETVDKYAERQYENNLGGQFSANYALGRLGQDESLAWTAYLRNPTEENRRYAETLSAVAQDLAGRNTDALADENQILPIITQDFASYLPQLVDQTKYSAVGGAAGLAIGSLAGMGAAGLKAGIAAGSGKYSYDTMQGAAFKTLLDLGIDEATAAAAAQDEAVISSLIESADTLVDLATLGTGNLINTIVKKGAANTAKKGVVKTLLSGLAKYGINITEEGLQEGLQQAVSIANANRAAGGEEGAGGLARDALSVYWGRLRGTASEEDTASIREAERGGARLAALMGGATMAGSAIANQALGRAAGRASTQENAGTSSSGDVSPASIMADAAAQTEAGQNTQQETATTALNRSQANKVIADPERKASFEAQYGVRLTGTKAEQARTVMSITAESEAQRQENTSILADALTGETASEQRQSPLVIGTVEGGENILADAIDAATGEQYTERRGEMDAGQTAGAQLHGTSGEGVQGRETGGNIQSEGTIGQGNLGVSGVVLLSDEAKNEIEARGSVVSEASATEDRVSFCQSLDNARNADGRNGWAVTPKTPEELAEAGARTFMGPNGAYGFAVTPDGDIEAVFANKSAGAPRGVTQTMIPQAIANGGTKLDCYGDGLVDLYTRYGFIPVARVPFVDEYANPGWTPDKGRPYVYFMMHNGDSTDTVAANYNNYKVWTEEELNALPLFDGEDGYDRAFAYRDGLLNQQSSQQNAQQTNGPFHPINQQAQAETQQTQGRGPVYIPVQDVEGRLTSKVSSTIANASMTPNEVAADVQRAANEGAFSYLRMTDKKAVSRAQARADSNYAVALADFRANVEGGMVSKENNVLGAVLANAAMQAGDYVTAMEILADLGKSSVIGAQATQSLNIINKLGAAGRVYLMAREVDRIQRDLTRRLGEDAPNIQVEPSLMESFAEAVRSGDEARIREASNAIAANVASQVPTTFSDKLNAWRYMVTLGNPRTQIRNFLGNLGFVIPRFVKNISAAGMEQFLPKGAERTKAILNPLAADDRARFAVGLSDFTNVESLVMSGGKYNETIQDDVRRNQQVFDLPLLEGYRKLTEKGMDKGDVIFSRPAYAEALAMYLKANGFTAADFTNGTMTEEQVARARDVAALEASRATYRDINELSAGMEKVLSGMRRYAQGNGVGANFVKAANFLTEGVLMFVRTPANVLARIIDYSPAGLVNGLRQLYSSVSSGKYTAAEAIDTLAAGLTGTGIMLLGMFMRKNGDLTGGKDKDEKQEAFNQLQGKQNYSLTIGDKSYPIEWLAPSAVSLFIGAELWDAYQKNGLNFREAVEELSAVADPLVEMSMLEGLQNFLETGSYGDASFINYISTAAVSRLQQYLPSLARQAENIWNENRQETYRYNDENADFLSPNAQRILGNTLNSVPGVDYNQVDYVDAWGRTQSNGGLGERMFNTLLNPGRPTTIQSGEVEAELQRLYDSGARNVFPQRIPQSYILTTRDENGEATGERHLTPEEYVRFNTTMGQTRRNLIEGFVSSDTYGRMGTDERASVISAIYEYGMAMAVMEAEPNYQPSGWIARAMEASDPGKSIQLYVGSKSQTPADGYDDVPTWQKLEYIVQNTESREEADEYIPQYLSGKVPEKYEMARSAGYSPNAFTQAYSVFNTTKSDEGKSNKRQKVVEQLTGMGWPEVFANQMYSFLSYNGELDDWKW